MDGPRDDHTKQSKSERRKTNAIYHLYVESKKNDTYELIYKAGTRVTDIENKFIVTKREAGEGRNKLSLRLIYHVHTDTYKTDNQQVPTYGKGTKHFQYLITYNVKEFEKEYIRIYNWIT